MVAQNNKSTKVCKEKTLEKVVSRLFNSIVWGKTRSLVAKPNSTFLLFLFTFCSNNNGEDEDFLWQWLRQGIFYIFRSGVECFIDVFMNVLLFWCFDILFGIDWLYLFDFSPLWVSDLPACHWNHRSVWQPRCYPHPSQAIIMMMMMLMYI